MVHREIDADTFINENRDRLREAMQLALHNADLPADRAHLRSALRSLNHVAPAPVGAGERQESQPAADTLSPLHNSVRQPCHLTMPTAALALPSVISAIAADTGLSTR